jgi:hypothetical protein
VNDKKMRKMQSLACYDDDAGAPPRPTIIIPLVVGLWQPITVTWSAADQSERR